MDKKLLLTWVGGNDLEAESKNLQGPILRTLLTNDYDEVHLLYNYNDLLVEKYVLWLETFTNCKKITHRSSLSSPINFSEIYLHANKVLNLICADGLTPDILLSPGTPAMQAVWILLGKTKYQSKFIQASVEQGVQYIDIPFQIAAEYTPSIQKITNQKLQSLQNEQPLEEPGFENIKTQNPTIKVLKKQAAILSGFDVPILITGETGTGKELFARAIHHQSPRSNKPFIAVNCGSLPLELIDSLLFGHKKGAFTGAHQDHLGLFREAHEGTIFLDEFGDLPSSAQVKLLRVLQEGTVTPVGDTKEICVDIRVIAATHKNLIDMVADGTFREDLFYRVSVGMINIPPVRNRDGDLLLIAEQILATLKEKETILKDKYFSVLAKNIIIQHNWPGNVREMQSTIMRAALWSEGDEINEINISDAIIKRPTKPTAYPVKDFSQSIDINKEISFIVSNYIKAALAKTGNNKTKAAELLGLKNYQTLNNWIEKYGIH